MHRRDCIAGVSASVIFGVSGCIDTISSDRNDDTWTPNVDSEETELMPGEQGSLHIEADEIGGFQVLPAGETTDTTDGAGESEDNVELDIHTASPSPSPDRQLDEYPPIWQWEEPTAVSVSLPVYVGEHVESGEYPYNVTVDEGMDRAGESETVEFTISVTEE